MKDPRKWGSFRVVKVLNMYKQPKNQEEIGGVIASFGQKRLNEAIARAHEFIIEGPVRWIRTNQPVRKAVLLESLEILRPAIEVGNEHYIETWQKER